jgi:hypothetical protein
VTEELPLDHQSRLIGVDSVRELKNGVRLARSQMMDGNLAAWKERKIEQVKPQKTPDFRCTFPE